MNIRCLGVAPALLLGAVAVAQPLPATAFAALPAMQAPVISPDGKRLASIARGERGTFVYAAQLANNHADAVVEMGGALNARAGSSATSPQQGAWSWGAEEASMP